MDQTGGSDTPDSGIYSPDNGSRRSSMSSTDQSNGLHSRRASTDSGLGESMSNPSRDGKNARFSTSLDAQKVVSALTDNSAMTEEGIMPEITEKLEANNLTSASRTTTLRSGITTSDSNLRSSKRSTTTAQSIQVYATGPNNKTMPLNIKTSDTVDTLIQHMSRAFALGQNAYLIFEGQTLNLGSGLTVAKAGIKNNVQPDAAMHTSSRWLMHKRVQDYSDFKRFFFNNSSQILLTYCIIANVCWMAPSVVFKIKS